MTRALMGFVASLIAATGSASAALDGLTITPTPEGFSLRVPGTALPAVFALNDPPRLVVDVPVASALPNAPGLYSVPVDRWGIATFRTSQFGKDPNAPVTRLVFEVMQTPLWEVRRGGGTIQLSVVTGAGGAGAPIRVGEPLDAMPPLPPDGRAEAETPVADPARDATREDGIEANRGDLERNIGDPSRDVVDERQNRLWQRRAAELLAMAEVHWAAGNHRDGLESLHRVFEYYPSGEHVRHAHRLAAAFLCELHMGRDAAEHVVALFQDPATSDSLVTLAAETLVACPLEPESGRPLLVAFDRVRDRLPDGELRTRLGAAIGMALAEAGEDIPRAAELLAERVAANPDAAEAARVHRALATCHERDGELVRAAEAHLFAARLERREGANASLRDRSRAADAFFQAGELERALEQYRIVASGTDVAPELRSWALFQQANCFYRTRRYGEASDAYESLRGAFPDSYWSSQAAIRLSVLAESGLAGS